jgi:hypothetical protein
LFLKCPSDAITAGPDEAVSGSDHVAIFIIDWQLHRDVLRREVHAYVRLDAAISAYHDSLDIHAREYVTRD